MPHSSRFRLKVRTYRGCCYSSLRITCMTIGLLMILVMTTGAILTPKCFQSEEYIITFMATVIANITLIIAAYFKRRALLLLWFAYAVEFLIGFPLRQESISGYYRPFYEHLVGEYAVVIHLLEFFILKGFILYFMHFVCSYYLLLQDEEDLISMQNK